MSEIDEERVEQAIRVLSRVRRNWMRRPGVSAVDVGFPIEDGRLREDEIALRAHVVRKLPAQEVPENQVFPETEGGFTVDVLEVDYEVSAAPSATNAGAATGGGDPDGGAERLDPRRLQRLSPLVGGVSVGNPRIAAGTLGAVVWDRSDGSPHILSNWHVLAGNDASAQAGGCAPSRSAGQPYYQAAGGASPQALGSLEPYYQLLASLQPYYQSLAALEPYYQSLATLEPYYQLLAAFEPYYQSASDGQPFPQAAGVGEPICQPGRFDGGTSADVVAHLARGRLDRFMDAAVARLTGRRAYSPSVLGVGMVTGHTPPRLGMRVMKSGRSSGVTHGRIDGVSLSTTITWGSEKHYFEDQVHIVPLHPWPQPDKDFEEVSEGGDSGAVWLEEATKRAVGLHFAGDVGGVAENEHALANPMPRVAEALNVSFAPDPSVLAQAGPADPDGRVLRLLRSLGGARPGNDLSGLVKAVTGTGSRHGADGAGLSTSDLEALRAVIDAVLGSLKR
ncbi:MAG TPA: hypothetical protein VM324_13480 [Egibacteraceae bacterium]|nr:hypothetical protein [Egibacteraceae bacterium]